MARLIDLTGKRFGRLVVLKRVSNNKHKKSMWLCKCDCGNKIIVCGNNLQTGHTKSCGCLQKEKLIKRSTKHGYSQNNKTYKSWADMIQRCTNSNHKYYHYYGKRGITVCRRWIKFPNFLEDMGERPPNRTLERINNNKGYHKSNCKWATHKEQTRNKRNNRLETYNGKIQCIADWATEYNISYMTLWQRISKLSWTIEKALTTPIRKRRK